MQNRIDQKALITDHVHEFQQRYLDMPKGQKHQADYDRERVEVQSVFKAILAKEEAGQDITDDVLFRLLPHMDNKYNREHGHRISTWPVIQKDIKNWYENAGWQIPDNWPKVAKAVLELTSRCVQQPEQAAFEHFKRLDYIKGFESGIISPILYCLRPDLLVINSKNRSTVNYLFGLMGKQEQIDTSLINYLENITITRSLLDTLEEPLFDRYDTFDMFCHYMCSKRLGGYARGKNPVPKPSTRIYSKGTKPEVVAVHDGDTVEVVETTPAVALFSHEEVQWMLIELGNNLGCDVWIARNDQGKSFNGQLFADHTLARLPHLGFDQDTTRVVEFIDVLWLKGNAIVAAFEVEHSTSIYSGILRLSDLVTMQPNVNIDLFIVASSGRADKVARELNRPTFSSYALKLNERCKFIPYEGIKQLAQDTKHYAGFMDARVIQRIAQSCKI